MNAVHPVAADRTVLSKQKVGTVIDGMIFSKKALEFPGDSGPSFIAISRDRSNVFFNIKYAGKNAYRYLGTYDTVHVQYQTRQGVLWIVYCQNRTRYLGIEPDPV